MAETDFYQAFTMGLKKKISYFMRTIPNISNELKEARQNGSKPLSSCSLWWLCLFGSRKKNSIDTNEKQWRVGIPIFSGDTDKRI